MNTQRWGLPWPGAEIAAEAEAAGAEAFCTGDFADHDAYVSLAQLGGQTQSAQIGTAVAYAFTRSPWAHAASVRQLHQAALRWDNPLASQR